MPRGRADPAAASPIAPAILRWVAERGVDPQPIAARAGLPSDAAERDEVALTALGFGALLDEVARAVGDPFVALALPEALAPRRYGFAELAARASATVGEALQKMVRYAPLTQPGLELSLEVLGGEARFLQRTLGHPRGTGRGAHEYGLAAMLTHTRRELGRDEPALSVWFVHPRPRAIAPLERFFGTREIEFGAGDNGLAIPAALLDLPTSGGDPRLLATVEPLAEAALARVPRGDRIGPRVAACLAALLEHDPPGEATVGAVASSLKMSARTLQRRLSDEGDTFSELLDRAREQRGRALVLDPQLPLAEAAWRLGFADLATFSRAFRRWTGAPPGTWRRSQRR